MSNLRVVVIGAGVVGLCTAVQIQEIFHDVTIIADRFNSDTTSDGAAGIFRPTGDYLLEQDQQLARRWIKDSFDYYSSLLHSTEAAEAGVGLITGCHVFINKPKEQEPIYREFAYGYSENDERFLQLFSNLTGVNFSCVYTTLLVECRWFLPYLMKRFVSRGGKVKKRTLNSFSELVGQYDLVMNCSGLGSKQLINDNNMYPVRGQMIRVRAPWIKHFLYVDNDCWIIPGRDTVVIGGTRQKDDDDVVIRYSDKTSIWNRACTYQPSLASAAPGWDWVGLRPGRPTVRVEKEILHFSNGSLKVVHNYGHGGNGVSLAWGTAKHGCDLAQQFITSHL